MQKVYWLLERTLGGRCGPHCDPWEAAELYASGIRGLISLDRHGVDEAALQQAGILHLPLYQPMMFLMDEKERRMFLEGIEPAFAFIDEQRARNAPVVVHCYYGCDRTGAVLASYLVAREGESAASAIAKVRAAQPSALSAPGYAETVELFAEFRRRP